MPKKRPPYLQRQVTRHGKVVWYVRIRPNPRIRIHGEYGSQEFMAAYRAAISGQETPSTQKVSTNSLKWLIMKYRESSEWLSLSNATRRQRENIFLHVIEKAGDKPYQSITRKIIIASRDERADRPAQAGNFLKAMRGLFNWAVCCEYVNTNPCDNVKAPKLTNSQGFAVWTEDDVDRYEARWGEGTKERVWLHVLLYTGLRRGDAVRLGQQHIHEGVATIRTEKSGYKTTVTLRILPVLQKTLDAGPIGETTFICGKTRQPLTKESFGNLFRKACNKAGVKKSAHGVRKTSATRAANAGATEAQLKALFGWTDDEMPSLYTKNADRVRLATEAIKKLEK